MVETSTPSIDCNYATISSIDWYDLLLISTHDGWKSDHNWYLNFEPHETEYIWNNSNEPNDACFCIY